MRDGRWCAVALRTSLHSDGQRCGAVCCVVVWCGVVSPVFRASLICRDGEGGMEG